MFGPVTTKLLPKGLIVHINGFPVKLKMAVQAETSEDNWRLIGPAVK